MDMPPKDDDFYSFYDDLLIDTVESYDAGKTQAMLRLHRVTLTIISLLLILSLLAGMLAPAFLRRRPRLKPPSNEVNAQILPARFLF